MAKKDLDERFLHVKLLVSREIKPVAVRSFWEPRVDVFESDEHFLIKAELAGVQQEDVRIIYVPDHHTILIRGERRDQADDRGVVKGCHLLEIYYGPFEREVPLPNVPIDEQKIEATLHSGLLLISIPKGNVRDHKITLHIRKV